MAKMTNNKKIKFGMFLLIGILLIVSISAYSRSTTQYIPPTSSSNYLNKQGISLTQSFSEDTCQAGQDFVVQISPLGCTPTVVRSDLLEEQNVPVFCQLAATKINPLIYVEAIESISFKGDYPREVSGVGFYPANAGIKTSQSTLLNSPILNNIGYAVIVLRKQPNESAMPDWVEGNMTAKIKYDVKNAIQDLFKVNVEAVRTMRVHGKYKRVGKNLGKTPDWKKAIVTLVEGDRIDFLEGA